MEEEEPRYSKPVTFLEIAPTLKFPNEAAKEALVEFIQGADIEEVKLPPILVLVRQRDAVQIPTTASEVPVLLKDAADVQEEDFQALLSGDSPILKLTMDIDDWVMDLEEMAPVRQSSLDIPTT